MITPQNVRLAQLPTPIQPLHRLTSESARAVFVKRDDLTGSHLSGNKVRKLEYLFADAMAQDASHIITCGGMQSNHCRATALAAVSLGIQPVLLLRTRRGTPNDLPDIAHGNLLLNRLADAVINTCDPDGYERRNELMADMAATLRKAGHRPYIIPEGGSNALGAYGYVQAAREIVDQMATDLPDSVVVATGSGGTLAGLAIGFKACNVSIRVFGIAVCDDEATFRSIVMNISEESHRAFGLPLLEPGDFEVLDGFQGRGYALSTPKEIALIRKSARLDGLVLDPVYTGKAFGALQTLIEQDHAKLGQRICFVHTGGIFGLLAAADDLASM
jgi:D-cysteine desulfhydrase